MELINDLLKPDNFWFVALGVILFLIAFNVLYFVVNKRLDEAIRFLKYLQVDGKLTINKKVLILKSLEMLKKIITWTIISIVFIALFCTALIVIDSKNFFKDILEIERKKVNLRTQESVDSLQQVIIAREFSCDSLRVKDSVTIDFKDKENYELNGRVLEMASEINSLQREIKSITKINKNAQ